MPKWWVLWGGMREQMKADLSINKRGRDHSAWKHIQFALDACPDCPVLNGCVG